MPDCRLTYSLLVDANIDIPWGQMMHDDPRRPLGEIFIRMVGPAGSNKFAERICSERSLHCYIPFQGCDGVNKATGTLELFAALTPGLLVFYTEGQNFAAFSPFNKFNKK